MGKKNPITLEEKKRIQLEMLQEIDAFCRANNIRYTLSSGTLIGAIRHHGYIPWDDDVDIAMPLPDIIRFRELFHSEKLKYLDLTVDRNFDNVFPRIAYNQTYTRKGKKRDYGVNIDLYPVVGVSEDENERRIMFEKAKRLFIMLAAVTKWRQRACKYLLLYTIPGFYCVLKKNWDCLIANSVPYNDTSRYFRIASPITDKFIAQDSLDYDMFDQLIDWDFEGCKLQITGHYDRFLTHKYGDYMQLPPEDQRVPYHGGVFYFDE